MFLVFSKIKKRFGKRVIPTGRVFERVFKGEERENLREREGEMQLLSFDEE